MSRYLLWRAIVSASDDIGELTRRCVGRERGGSGEESSSARTGPPQRETRWRKLEEGNEPRTGARSAHFAVADEATLGPLLIDVKARLERLWAELRHHEALRDGRAFEQAQNALVIHFDERIMELLPGYLRPDWKLLQTQYTGSSVGGEDFYRYVEAALVDRTAPSLVFEVYYYCLSHEFEGRYAADHGTICAYQQRIAERIELIEPDIPRPAGTAPMLLEEPWPMRRYYLLGLLAFVAFAVSLIWATRAESFDLGQRVEMTKGACINQGVFE